jgi:hypothetical protein
LSVTSTRSWVLGQGVRRDQHIVAADRPTMAIEFGPQPGVDSVGRCLERQHLEPIQHRFDALAERLSRGA